jgi:hypothetical protein
MVMCAAHTRACDKSRPVDAKRRSGRSLLLESDKGFYFRMQRPINPVAVPHLAPAVP